METVAETAAETRNKQETTRTQIRGSSLFLFGRMLSLGINFFTQVLTVRYLSTRDYGELAYGLAVVSFLRLFASLGLQDAIPRFVPIYRENAEYGRMFGTILLAAGAVLLTGILIIGMTWQAPLFLMPITTHEGLPPLALLSILIVLVPVESADALLDSLFASFAGTRDIFFRRYLLGPGLKLGVVVLLLWMKSSIVFLAYGYVATGAVGVLIYGALLIKLLLEQGLLQRFQLKEVMIRSRETFAFVLPGLVSAIALCIAPMNILLLGRLRTMPEVAFYRAPLPIAELNNIGFASFTLLYTPLAARLFAKLEYSGINWPLLADSRVDVRTVFSSLRRYLFSCKASRYISFRSALRAIRYRTFSALPRDLFQCYCRIQPSNAKGVQKVALRHRGKCGDNPGERPGEHRLDKAIRNNRGSDRFHIHINWIQLAPAGGSITHAGFSHH